MNFTAVLPCFYIYYDKEQYRVKGAVGSSSNEFPLDKEMTDTGNYEEEKWDGEKYEYDKAIGADRTFLKFKKRLDAYPEQCFRQLKLNKQYSCNLIWVYIDFCLLPFLACIT